MLKFEPQSASSHKVRQIEHNSQAHNAY